MKTKNQKEARGGPEQTIPGKLQLKSSNQTGYSTAGPKKLSEVIVVTSRQAEELREIFSDIFVEAAIELGRMKIVDIPGARA